MNKKEPYRLKTAIENVFGISSRLFLVTFAGLHACRSADPTLEDLLTQQEAPSQPVLVPPSLYSTPLPGFSCQDFRETGLQDYTSPTNSKKE